MENETNEQATADPVWRVKQVYAMAAVCLLVGLVIGYLHVDPKNVAIRTELVVPVLQR